MTEEQQEPTLGAQLSAVNISVCVAWIPRKRLRNNKDQCLVPRLLMKVSVLERLTESD